MLDSPSFGFEWWWILCLLPLPWLYRLLKRALPQSSPALKIPVYNQLLAGQRDTSAVHRGNLYSWLLLTLVWLGCLLAAARPVWVGEVVQLPTSGRDLMLAVDISGSMETLDMPLGNDLTDRITAVQVVLGQFVERRVGDRLGLILFGSMPYLQVPLTFDHNTLYNLLHEARIGFAGSATAIGSAIGMAVKRLQERPENHRILILLTDGANTAGTLDPMQAADAAAEFGVKIYTIGIGADSMLQRSLFGTRRVNPSADLDEETLQAIADKTGGRYFRARDVNELNNIYQELDQLEPIEQDPELLRPRKALFHWPLALALIAALALLAQRHTRGEQFA